MQWCKGVREEVSAELLHDEDKKAFPRLLVEEVTLVQVKEQEDSNHDNCIQLQAHDPISRPEMFLTTAM